MSSYRCDVCGRRGFGDPDLLHLDGGRGSGEDVKTYTVCRDSAPCAFQAFNSWYYKAPQLLVVERRKAAWTEHVTAKEDAA